MPITTVRFRVSNGDHSGVSMNFYRLNELSTNESLRILYLNSNGLTQDKLHDGILGKLFKNYDIILLAETWSNGQGHFALNVFHYFDYPRDYGHTNCKRNSGGHDWEFLPECLLRMGQEHGDVIVSFILDKSVFGFENNLYLGCVYIVCFSIDHQG